MQQVKNIDRLMIEMKEIFKYITKDMYEKIPNSIKSMINDYNSDNYEFKYDVNKELIEQNICTETKNFIGYLHYTYWADEEGKKRIEKAWDENQAKIDEKYSYENLFDKKEEKTIEESPQIIDEQVNLTVVEKSWFKRILNKIKSLFGFCKKG